jgi:subtilisin family serine protease
LDTGIDLNHPAFAGRLVPGYDFVDNDNDPSEVGVLRENPSYGHGTHVAGIIALTAPNAKIMPIRVLDTDGEGRLWQIARAILWAADPDGTPDTPDGASIINMSFGYPPEPGNQLRRNRFLHDLMEGCDGVPVPGEQTFGERTVMFVAAAGNGGDSALIYPAAERADSVSNLLSVGATTRLDRLALFSTMAAGDSGGDRWVRAVAPGENIVSAIPGGRYGMWSGTSMAAPIASGIAALVKSEEPTLTPVALVDRIDDTGIEWDCRANSPRQYIFRTARVDAFCALMNLKGCGQPETCPQP